MRRVIASLLAISLVLPAASCSLKRKIEPDEETAEIAAEEEYEVDFDLVEETEEDGETTWIFLSTDGIIETHVTFDEEANRFKFTEIINRPSLPSEAVVDPTLPSAAPTATRATDPTSNTTVTYPPIPGGYGIIHTLTADGVDYDISSDLKSLIASGAVASLDSHRTTIEAGETEYGIDVSLPGVNCWNAEDVDLSKPMFMITLAVTNPTNVEIPIEDCRITSVNAYASLAGSTDVPNDVGINTITLGVTTVDELIATFGQPHYNEEVQAGEDVSTTIMYGLDAAQSGYLVISFTFTNGVLTLIDVEGAV
ncbi:MAG: hypothetical protein K5745_03460 [Saccharofermentans sp.]|nr:hypothetical protein [Saccharofermentans sp.]